MALLFCTGSKENAQGFRRSTRVAQPSCTGAASATMAMVTRVNEAFAGSYVSSLPDPAVITVVAPSGMPDVWCSSAVSKHTFQPLPDEPSPAAACRAAACYSRVHHHCGLLLHNLLKNSAPTCASLLNMHVAAHMHAHLRMLIHMHAHLRRSAATSRSRRGGEFVTTRDGRSCDSHVHAALGDAAFSGAHRRHLHADTIYVPLHRRSTLTTEMRAGLVTFLSCALLPFLIPFLIRPAHVI